MKVVIHVVIVLLLAITKATGQDCATDGTCDTHERCPVWKEQGECTKNKHYMEKYCPVSCADSATSAAYDMDCEDVHLSCPVWAELGECDKNPDMVKYCAKSCNTCQFAEKDETLCNNKHQACQRWADLGECKKNPAYMHIACPRSCGTCETIINAAKRKMSALDHDRELRRSLEDATEKFGERQIYYGEDVHQALEFLKISIEYMASDRVMSLPQEIRESCRNTHAQCSLWASFGECEANPTFMKKACAPACRSCDWTE